MQVPQTYKNMIHPLLLPYVDKMYGAMYCEENDEWCLNVEEFFPDRGKWLERAGMDNIPIILVAPGVWAAPILSEEVCDELSKYCDNKQETFQVNPDETEGAQIPEIVLQQEDEPLFNILSDISDITIIPLMTLIYGTQPTYYRSIQLARYTPHVVKCGVYHIDVDSVFTCTISLCPEKHKGGGTSVLPLGIFGKEYSIPPLEKGWGLFFNGRVTQHKGLPVEEGTRDLLVFWMD